MSRLRHLYPSQKIWLRRELPLQKTAIYGFAQGEFPTLELIAIGRFPDEPIGDWHTFEISTHSIYITRTGILHELLKQGI